MSEETAASRRFVVRADTPVRMARAYLTWRHRQSVRRQRDVVRLRQVGTNVVNAFPGEVFPDEAVARIRAGTQR